MYQYKIQNMMEDFRSKFGATPLYLRMSPERFEEFVSELKEDQSQFKPLTKEVWQEALDFTASHYMNTNAAFFNEMRVLEFTPVAMYAGMLVGTSPLYTKMAVSFKVSVEMDTETSGVVYESALFNT